MAGRVDALYFFLLAISTFFSLLIAGLIVFYAIRYRRRDPLSVGEVLHGMMALEIGWTVIPFIIAMVIFVWGASVFFAISRPPDETLNIYVVGKQWMWKFQHLDGQREINELHVPVGRAGEADHDVGGRDPRRVRAGVPREGRRHPRPLHQPLVPADQGRDAITCSAPSTAAPGIRA